MIQIKKFGSILTLLLVFTCISFGQSSLNKGFVKYEITDMDGEGAQAMMLQGSTITLYFDGEHQKMEMSMMMGFFRMQSIVKDDTMVMLTDAMGSKYRVNEPITKEEAKEKIESNLTNLVIDKKDKKEILDYKCTKATVDNKKGGSMEIYYTKKIAPFKAYFQDLVPKELEGLPLQYTMISNGKKMTFTAVEISESVDSSVFDIPEGYEEMTKEEFEKAMGGMGGF